MRPAEEQELQRAILALKAGNKTAAAEIFMEALQENPTLEEAWVGLSFCAKTVEQRKSCLKRALGINPNHTYARSALTRIEQAQQSNNFHPSPETQKQLSSRTNKTWTGNQIFAAFLGLILIVVCVFGGLIMAQNQQQAPQQVMAQGRPQFLEFYADW